MRNKPVILCVDDEKIILDSLKMQLKNHFNDMFVYETAENASDALDLIDELVGDGVRILIIVSDWLMPGIKGDDFLILVHEKYPEIIKVLLTGQADEQAIQRAYEKANLLKCLHKPWHEKELVEVIQAGLGS
ncbi:MAG: response regulator [Candidatus Cloacimonetes bacterium]|jgi:response regulator RpfG family c-di-GMP phosphodiesterase|nr:response regulator [Candidatus Cloacimonadota bacterium]HPM01339.1 response regulator [Candidatus Cloacimonadota bacterium]